MKIILEAAEVWQKEILRNLPENFNTQNAPG